MSRFILHEISSRHCSQGHRLELIRALDSGNQVLAQQNVRVDAPPGVYPCEKPIDIGHGVLACP